MAEKYLFFNSTQDDTREYQANDIADYWNSFLSTGLISDNGEPQLKVVAEGTNRIIEIQKGRALIDGHLYLNDSTKLKIEEPDALYDRIDRVVIRYDNTIKNRFIKAFVLRGETSENPIPPQLTRGGDIYELSLAQIRVVGGKSFIEQKDIVDERLKEDVCGLASSLVSVPTSIFDELFKEYMDKIAMEWQDWYNSVERDTYVTNTQFDAHNRQLDRQLANLNAIADIDEKAIGNTGKFYDLFDGTNDKSVAKIDGRFAVVSKNISSSDTIIEIFGANPFAVGEEITFAGLETSLSTAIIQIDRRIIAGTKNSLTIEKPLNTTLLVGANIHRTSLDFKGNPSRGVSIKSWGSPVKQPTSYSSAIYPMNSAPIAINSKGNILTLLRTSTSSEYFLHEYDEVTKAFTKISTTSVKFYSPDLKYGIGGTNNDELYEINAENKTMFKIDTIPSGGSLVSGIGTCNGDAVIVKYNYIDQTETRGSYNRYYVFRYSVKDKVYTKFSDGRMISDGYKNCTVIDLKNNDFGLILKNTSSALSTAFSICDKYGNNLAGIIGKNRDGYISKISNEKYLCVHDAGASIITCTGNSVPIVETADSWKGLGSISITSDGLFAISSLTKSVYGISADYLSPVLLSTLPSLSAETIMHLSETDILLVGTFASNTFSYKEIIATKKYPLVPTRYRYKFLHPVKNLAGWLFAKETPTAVKAELSLVDQDENENFKELTVTQNENEYEFLETENLYLKDKATLKLTIEGGNLDKLLGGIE